MTPGVLSCTQVDDLWRYRNRLPELENQPTCFRLAGISPAYRPGTGFKSNYRINRCLCLFMHFKANKKCTLMNAIQMFILCLCKHGRFIRMRRCVTANGRWRTKSFSSQIAHLRNTWRVHLTFHALLFPYESHSLNQLTPSTIYAKHPVIFSRSDVRAVSVLILKL